MERIGRRSLGNHPYMTSDERVKLLEYKVAVLGVQLEALTAALGRFLGDGLGKPIPFGLARAIQDVTALGISDDAFQQIGTVAERGFGVRPPSRVAELPQVIDLG